MPKDSALLLPQKKQHMQKHTLDLIEEEDYLLYGFYTQEETYRLVFLLNKSLNIHLERNKKDQMAVVNQKPCAFITYKYQDVKKGNTIVLYHNQSSTQGILSAKNKENLFKDHLFDTPCYLYPELKSNNFILKIETHAPAYYQAHFFNALKSIAPIVYLQKVATGSVKMPAFL